MPFDNVDKDLLAVAHVEAERFAVAERNLQAARADYQRAVRRLHLAGASLRDVARALGISHQRVQQIVQANGGSWWSRVWHNRNVTRDMACSFCGLSNESVAKLIAGPKVYICDACVSRAERVVRGDTLESTTGGPRLEPVASPSRARCSFCGQKSRGSDAGGRLVSSRDRCVCGSCLDLCRRILDDRSQVA